MSPCSCARTRFSRACPARQSTRSGRPAPAELRAGAANPIDCRSRRPAAGAPPATSSGLDDAASRVDASRRRRDGRDRSWVANHAGQVVADRIGIRQDRRRRTSIPDPDFLQRCPLRNTADRRRPSQAFRQPRRFDRVLAVRPGHLAAQPRRRKHLARDCTGRCGSNAPRTRCISVEIVAGTSSACTRALSAPTPCSPVIEPPASMQYRRISAATSTARPPARERARRSRSADAGCRRRRETRCRCAGPIALEIANPAEHLGQLRARHDAVLHVVVRRHAAHRRKRRLAPLPDARALLVVSARSRSSSRRARRQISSTIANSSRTSAAGPSSSTISTASARENSGARPLPPRSIASASIISTAAGMMPAPMIADTAAPAASIVSNAASSVCTALRPRRIRTVDLRDDRERAFRADQQAEQIGPGRIERARRRCAPARRSAARPRRRARGGR